MQAPESLQVELRAAMVAVDEARAAAAAAKARYEALVAEVAAEVVVLCGAAMAGMPARIADRVPVPVIDGIAAGVGLCEMLVRLKPAKARLGSLAHPGQRPSIGLAPALEAMLKPD